MYRLYTTACLLLFFPCVNCEELQRVGKCDSNDVDFCDLNAIFDQWKLTGRYEEDRIFCCFETVAEFKSKIEILFESKETNVNQNECNNDRLCDMHRLYELWKARNPKDPNISESILESTRRRLLDFRKLLKSHDRADIWNLWGITFSVSCFALGMFYFASRDYKSVALVSGGAIWLFFVINGLFVYQLWNHHTCTVVYWFDIVNSGVVDIQGMAAQPVFVTHNGVTVIRTKSLDTLLKWEDHARSAGCKFLKAMVFPNPRVVLQRTLGKNEIEKFVLADSNHNPVTRAIICGEQHGDKCDLNPNDLLEARSLIEPFDIIAKNGKDFREIVHDKTGLMATITSDPELIEDPLIEEFGVNLDLLLRAAIFDGRDFPKLEKRHYQSDAICYGRRYPDLFHAFCGGVNENCRVRALHYHYLKHGISKNYTYGCKPNHEVRDTKRCGLVYYYHFARCGGTSMVRFLQKTLPTKTTQYDYDFFANRVKGIVQVNASEHDKFRDSERVQFNWIEQLRDMEQIVASFQGKESEYIMFHQHSFTPGLRYTMENLTRWRKVIESKGCQFSLVTILRDPRKRYESHLKYFQVPEHEIADFSIGYGNNYLLRFLIHGECNYQTTPYRCTGHDIPGVSIADLQEGMQLLRKFDLIGTMKDFDNFKQAFEDLTGYEAAKLDHVRASRKKKLPLTPSQEHLIDNYAIELDKILVDSVLYNIPHPEMKKENVYSDAICYAERYDSLFKEFCDEDRHRCRVKEIAHHWHNFGQSQNLTFGCITIDPSLEEHLRCYAERYSDLFEGFCKNFRERCNLEEILIHWKNFGSKTEDQIFGCFEVPYKLREPLRKYAESYDFLLKQYCQGDKENCNLMGLYVHMKTWEYKRSIIYGLDNREIPDVPVEEVSGLGFFRLPGLGECQPSINQQLPSKRIKESSEIACATECAAYEECVGFGFHLEDKVCELQCGMKSKLCDVPAFPVEIDSCTKLQLTNDLDRNKICFAKENACLY